MPLLTNFDGPRGPITRILDTIARICMIVAGTQMVFLIAIFGWLVFGRYVLNDTPTWVEQAALLLVVWITFLGGAVGVWTKSHLSVDFLREMMPMPIRVPLRWVAVIGVIIFGYYLAAQGFDLAEKTWRRRIPMLGIAEGWRAVPMVICGVLSVLFSLVHLADLARGIDPMEH
ncbi:MULTISPECIES: TRAP transporter small permease [Roseobacteraceae]|jgi:TRAP-type C4-dicarboxylate transport system permease small subunit|uniref:TRAP transporter small permease protein n=1 Tax=Pseudosulfitobacter pseudonitzschiae TaxID=1402135 RepID=A0A221K6W5_9RHOB|nr:MULTISPECIES: TRAP transporter small permease [Roseobacteraceae]ASM74610.1 sialic acid TRAP transporter small permease protein SiaQ [Pseudosulfitobacter pseudonitzschiae]